MAASFRIQFSLTLCFLLSALLGVPGRVAAQTCLSNWASPIPFSMDHPHGSAVGDWNDDGIPDFAVAYSAHVVIVQGTGTTPLSASSFQPLISIFVNGSPFAVTAADINNDSILDLVTANLSGTVAVLLGNGTGGTGNGTLADPVYFPAGTRPFDVVAADFDGDGRLDLAVSENDCATGGVNILMALPPLVPGQPRFAAPVNRTLGCNAALISTADFNGDHLPDLAIAVYGIGKLQVLLGLGGGAFSSPVTVASGLTGVFEARAADIDKDGIVDLVSACLTGTRVHWGLGSGGVGDGTFAAGVLLLAGNSASVAVGDQDGDGDQDLAFETGNVLRLLLQTGTRTFTPTMDVLNLSTVYGARFADFDRDGRADILLDQYNSSVADVIPSLCIAQPPAPTPPSPDPIGPGWDAQGKAIAPGVMGQGNATLIADGSGGVFVVWLENSHIRAQHLGPGGQRLWTAAGIDLCPVPLTQSIPIAISDDAGGMYVAWIHDPAGSRRVRLIRMSAMGVPAAGWSACGLELSTSTPLNAGAIPRIALDGAGGVFVTDLETSGLVKAYRFTASGVPAAGWTQGSLIAAGSSGGGGGNSEISSNDVVANGSGGLSSLFSYSFNRTDPCCLSGTATEVWGVSSTGRLSSGVFKSGVSTAVLNQLASGQALMSYAGADGNLHAVLVSSSAAGLWDVSVGPNAAGTLPRAVSDGAGGAFLVWDATGPQGADLFGSRITSAGGLATGWITSPTTLLSQPGTQREVWPAYDGIGGLMYVWRDERSGDPDVYFGRVDGTGHALAGWPGDGLAIVSMPGAQRRPFVTRTDPISAIVVWEDLRTGTAQLYAQHVTLDQPVATLASLRSVSVTSARAEIEWLVDDTPGALEIQRAEVGGAWTKLGTANVGGDHVIAGVDERVIAGKRFGYRLVSTSTAETISGSEVWVDVPGELTFALKGFETNPSTSGVRVGFTLPLAAPAKLEVFDVSGRAVFAREVGSLGAGRHRLALGALGPGFYVIRLTQGGDSRTQRGVVLR